MKILITGAVGFIGSHLCEELLLQGADVIGIDNFNDFYDPELKRQNLLAIQLTAKKSGRHFQCYSGDICDADLMGTALSEHAIELVVHLAAMAGVRPSLEKPLLYERVNGLGTYTLLEAMKVAGVKNIVFGSSSSVYGLNTKVPFAEEDTVNLPFSPYAQTKRSNELMLRVYHQIYQFNVASLRFFTVYGPRQRPDLAIRKFTTKIFAREAIEIFGDGSFRRDFTYVDDIIDGVSKAIQWLSAQKSPQCEIFNLGESATTSVTQLISLLEKSTGLSTQKIFKPAQPGDVPITFADITKSKKILGYNPQTKIEDGIPRFVEWYLDTHQAFA